VNDFDIFGAAASGMQAQRAAMDVDARNVALSATGDVRHPVHGLVPQFASTLATQQDAGESPVAAIEARLDETFDGDEGGVWGSQDDGGGQVVAFTGVRPSAAPIDSISEMINVMDAQRAYEADASVFDVGKRLFERTVDMGRL
jgi:flagellar basal body rod protein FlgC